MMMGYNCDYNGDSNKFDGELDGSMGMKLSALDSTDFYELEPLTLHLSGSKILDPLADLKSSYYTWVRMLA
jgi:hypothetical protein